jgi:two-component system response regulator FixJ
MPDRIVHIVGDDPDVGRSLHQLLLPAAFTTVLYPSPLALLRVASGLMSGCLLIDMRISKFDGLDLQRKLNELRVLLPVVIITGHGNVWTAVQAMKAGAADFIEEPFDDGRLVRALEGALNRSWRINRRHDATVAAQRIGKLSHREREVLNGLVAGQSNKLIADDLGISVRTVEAHRARMFNRLGTHQLAEAVRLAMMATLVETGEQ